MKFLDLALIAGAAYLIFSQKGSSDVTGGSFDGSGGGPAIPPPAGIKADTKFTGETIPGTKILVSQGFSDLMKKTGATVEAALAPIPGKITVTPAPVVTVRSSSGGSSTSSPQISAGSKAEINQIFQKQYISGGYVPSSVLAGKMTKTDVLIASNLAKKSFN